MARSSNRMLVLVMFGEVQPSAECHQRTRDEKLRCYRFTQKDDCYCGANERRCGKIRTGTGGSEVA